MNETNIPTILKTFNATIQINLEGLILLGLMVFVGFLIGMGI